ncbi:MAG TPA: YrdB family protein [Ktedonobacterales bacterium]
MITGLKGANLALTFLLELSVIVALAWWGWTTGPTLPLKIVLGTAAPLIAIGVWAMYGAPRSARRLKGLAYWLLRIVFDAAGAVALYAAGLHTTGVAFAVIAVVNCALGYLWKQE